MLINANSEVTKNIKKNVQENAFQQEEGNKPLKPSNSQLLLPDVQKQLGMPRSPSQYLNMYNMGNQQPNNQQAPQQQNIDDVQIAGVSQINIRLLLSLMQYGKSVHMLVPLSPKAKYTAKVISDTMQQWKYGLIQNVTGDHLDTYRENKIEQIRQKDIQNEMRRIIRLKKRIADYDKQGAYMQDDKKQAALQLENSMNKLMKLKSDGQNDLEGDDILNPVSDYNSIDLKVDTSDLVDLDEADIKDDLELHEMKYGQMHEEDGVIVLDTNTDSKDTLPKIKTHYSTTQAYSLYDADGEQSKEKRLKSMNRINTMGQSSFNFQTMQGGKPLMVKWIKDKKNYEYKTQQMKKRVQKKGQNKIFDDMGWYVEGDDEEDAEEQDTTNDKYADDDNGYNEPDTVDTREEDPDVISSVVHVDLRMIPIFPNRLGILPSIKIRRMLSVEEMISQQKKGFIFQWKRNGIQITDFNELKMIRIVAQQLKSNPNSVQQQPPQQQHVRQHRSKSPSYLSYQSVSSQQLSVTQPPNKNLVKSSSQTKYQPVQQSNNQNSDQQSLYSQQSQQTQQIDTVSISDSGQFPVEYNILPLYRPVRVQLLVFWAESDARITYPYVNQQELQMRESLKKEEHVKRKREMKALEAELNDLRQQGGQMNIARSGQNRLLMDIGIRIQNIEAELEQKRQEIAKERRLRQKREEEHKLRDGLRAKKLPERLIVRVRATDAKSEMVETQPASFTIETNPDMENTFMRDPTRGYFYEEFDIVTDERAPLVVSLIQQDIKDCQLDTQMNNQQYALGSQQNKFQDKFSINYDNNNDIVTKGLNINYYQNTTIHLLNSLNNTKKQFYLKKKLLLDERQLKQIGSLKSPNALDYNSDSKSDFLAPLTLSQFTPSNNQFNYQQNEQVSQRVTFSPSSTFYYDETALTTVAIPVFEAAKRQGEFYLVRYVDEERGYALCLGICVHHMKMVRRLFETPKIGMMMQMYLPLTHHSQTPYPPVCVTRVTGDCMAEWEDIENERKKRNEVIVVQSTTEKMEQDEQGRSRLKSMLYQSQSSYGFQPRSYYGFQPRTQYGIQSFYNVVTATNTPEVDKEEEENETEIDWLTDPGYSRRALVFSCVPIVKRPVRIWRVGKGNWGRWNTAPQFMNAQRQLDRKRKAQLQRQYLNKANVGSNYNKNWMFFDPDNKFISIFQFNQYLREQNVDQNQKQHLTRFTSFFGSFDQSITDNELSNPTTNNIILARNMYENKYFGKTEVRPQNSIADPSNQSQQSDSRLRRSQDQFVWEGEKFWYNHLELFGEVGDGDDYEDWAMKQKWLEQQGMQQQGQQQKGQLTSTSSQYGYSGMQADNKTKYTPNQLADFRLDQNQLIQQQMVDPSYLPPLDRYSLCKPLDAEDYLKYQYEATILPNQDLPIDEQINESYDENQQDDFNQQIDPIEGGWIVDPPEGELQQQQQQQQNGQRNMRGNIQQKYMGQLNKINLQRLFVRTEQEQILEHTGGNQVEYICNRIPQVDITRGFSFPVQPQLQLPPYPVISEYYTTPLPPPINVATEQNQLNNLQEEFMNDEEKKKKQIAKMYTNNETLSISFVNRNGYASMVSSFFDPKVYFGGRPAIICEFYAPIVKNEAFQAQQTAKQLQQNFGDKSGYDTSSSNEKNDIENWMPRTPSRMQMEPVTKQMENMENCIGNPNGFLMLKGISVVLIADVKSSFYQEQLETGTFYRKYLTCTTIPVNPTDGNKYSPIRMDVKMYPIKGMAVNQITKLKSREPSRTIDEYGEEEEDEQVAQYLEDEEAQKGAMNMYETKGSSKDDEAKLKEMEERHKVNEKEMNHLKKKLSQMEHEQQQKANKLKEQLNLKENEVQSNAFKLLEQQKMHEQEQNEALRLLRKQQEEMAMMRLNISRAALEADEMEKWDYNVDPKYQILRNSSSKLRYVYQQTNRSELGSMISYKQRSDRQASVSFQPKTREYVSSIRQSDMKTQTRSSDITSSTRYSDKEWQIKQYEKEKEWRLREKELLDAIERERQQRESERGRLRDISSEQEKMWEKARDYELLLLEKQKEKEFNERMLDKEKLWEKQKLDAANLNKARQTERTLYQQSVRRDLESERSKQRKKRDLEIEVERQLQIEKDKMWEKEKERQLKEMQSRNMKDKAEFETQRNTCKSKQETDRHQMLKDMEQQRIMSKSQSQDQQFLKIKQQEIIKDNQSVANQSLAKDKSVQPVKHSFMKELSKSSSQDQQSMKMNQQEVSKDNISQKNLSQSKEKIMQVKQQSYIIENNKEQDQEKKQQQQVPLKMVIKIDKQDEKYKTKICFQENKNEQKK